MFLQTTMEEHIACLRKALEEEERNFKMAIQEDKPFHIVKQFFLGIKMITQEIQRISQLKNTTAKAGML